LENKEINISPKILDKKAFEGLFKDYFKPLVAYGYKFVNDLDVSKEIVHDVFVNFWNNRESIDLNKSVKSYLFNSVANRCRNWIRDHKKFQANVELENVEQSSYQTSHDALEFKELEQKVNTAIENLPDKTKEIFKMNRFEGLKYAEIAKKLNVSVKTVEAQMSKALKALRKDLGQYLTLILIIYFNNIG
jgi:RNA polymerase sigma-70 factor (ECF subfamily)